MATKKTTIAAEIKVDTGDAEKEVKGLKDDIQGVGNATEGSIAQLKELKKQLKNAAAGSEEFKTLFNQIDDLEDKIKGSKKASSDWIDTLENAGGPLGMIGGALNRAKVATTSFSSALKASGIGLIVIAVGALAAAFAKNEGAMKKLEPIMNQVGRLLNGILGAMQPIIDAFIQFAEKALPYVTDGFRVAYSAASSFLQGIGLVGSAVKKFISGDFAGAWDDAKKSVTEFGTRYDAANERFIEGTKELTDAEKAEQEKRLANQKAAAEKREAELLKAQEKEQAELLKSYEDYLKRREFARKNLEGISRQEMKANEEADKEEADKKRNDQINKDLEWQKKSIANVRQTGAQILAIEEDATAKKIAFADAELQARLALANAIGNIAGGLSALFEKGTTAAKIAGLAEIAIGTGVGFIQGLDIAQKGAKAAGPAAPFAFPIFYASQILAVLAAASRAKSVMTQVKGGGGISIPSFGAPSIPSVSAVAPLAPSLQTTTLNQAQVNQIGNVAARAYVVESDISGNQERITRLNRAARIS
jgi:ribosomal protein S13